MAGRLQVRKTRVKVLAYATQDLLLASLKMEILTNTTITKVLLK